MRFVFDSIPPSINEFFRLIGVELMASRRRGDEYGLDLKVLSSVLPEEPGLIEDGRPESESNVRDKLLHLSGVRVMPLYG